MALNALGKGLNEDQVNRILGAEPKKGARWEEALATIQYFGCRGTLTAPSTLNQIKGWTDSGLPVLIAWNPEDRPWSHASCVFHVQEGLPENIPSDAIVQGSGSGLYVWVADPNIPNPSKMYRIVHEDFFYSKWGEDWGDFIVRRPALVVSLEVDAGGRQVMASTKQAGRRGKRPQQIVPKKDRNGPMRIKIDPTKMPGKDPFSNTEKHRRNDGPHRSEKHYRRREKHRKPYDREAESDSSNLASAELQSSFYKTLEGEPLQVTPLRTMPDYGERDFTEERTMMDINEMLAELKDSPKKNKKKANRRPAGGLYGYTKSTQRDVLASVRKVQKSANKIAKVLYAKDTKTFNFLHTHAERSNSLSARILCAAMENIGPKVASTKTAAGHGMYGYRLKTAKLALQACLDISHEAGSVAYDLHTRRTAKYEKITSFLRDHSKRGRCRYARILLRFYPDAPIVTASEEADEKEAKHEKGKSVALKDMPEELQSNAKDPSKHIKPKKKKASEDIDALIKLAEEALKEAGCEKLPLALKENCEKKQDEAKDSDDKDDDGKTAGCEKLPNEAMQKACEAKKKDGDKEGEDAASDKTAGCEKLPNKAMQEACEAKKKDGDKDDDDGDKKASRVRLTTRIAKGEIQRGQIKFGADDEDDDDDEKEGESLGRSQLPGEGDSNQNQPKLEGNSGYNPGSTEMNGDTGAPKAAAEDAELAAKAEGLSELPNDEESDKVQPDMKNHGFEVGGVKTSSGETVTYTTTTTHLPDGATLIWVE